MKAKNKNKISFRHLLHEGLKTPHNRIVTSGLIITLIYVPFWLRLESGKLLMISALALGFYLLWKQRHQLAKLEIPSEDRFLGHTIILGGIGLSPFCFLAEWSQKLNCMLVLIGIACAVWGIQFFAQYPKPSFLIGLGLFPHPGAFAQAVLSVVAPPQSLEQLMAWGGARGLQAIGQPAVANRTLISLPDGTVDVTWGCSGFDMAATVIVVSFVLGILLKQNVSKIVLIAFTGAVLALLLNVPRIMLVTMANAYWGQKYFEFWHGFWGGQILSSILFTIYYYIVMTFDKLQITSKKIKDV